MNSFINRFEKVSEKGNNIVNIIKIIKYAAAIDRRNNDISS